MAESMQNLPELVAFLISWRPADVAYRSLNADFDISL